MKFPILLASLLIPFIAQAETKPLKALLITGGCCHDYATQKDLLKEGLEKRCNVIVDQMHTDDDSETPDFPIYNNPEYAEGYDVVIHNMCAVKIDNVEVISDLLSPHKAGKPAVAIHCAMHSFRTADVSKPVEELGKPSSMWFEFLGLQSSGHGPKIPLSIEFSKAHPITAPLKDWTTGDEELYNNVHIFANTESLAMGSQEGEKDAVVVWTNDYEGTRVFGTTLGHHNETVGDPRFLDLIARGLLWSTRNLDDEGKVIKSSEEQ